MVKVSVVMPVYNCEDFLRGSIDSILNQSLDNLELICVDDGSDDDSLNILRDYENKDSRVKVFSLNHAGGGNARNFALNFVSGEYLYFMDADDVLDLNAFEDFYSISESKNLDFLMFKAKKFDVVNNFSFEHDYYNMARLSRVVKDKVFNFNDIGELIFDINVTPWCKFYNTQFIKNSRAQFRNYSKFHDNQFFWDIIFQAKRIYFLDEFYYTQNVNPNSLIELCDEKHCDAIDVLNDIDDLFKKHNQFERFKMQLYDRKVFLQVMRYGDIMDEYKELYFQKMKKDLMRFKNTDFRDYLVHSRKYIFDCVLFSKNHDDFDPLREYYYILLNESIGIDEKINQVKHCFENLSKNHKRFVFNYIKNDFLSQDIDSDNNEFFNIFNYKISVIIPVFNSENFIKNSFNSLLNQTIGFENLEVIFVDDASTDSSPKIIEDYSEKYENVISICLGENSGYAGLPRNIGMKYATSDYLMFLDSDDTFLEDACEILYNEMVSEDMDIVFGVHSDGNKVPRYLLEHILTDPQDSSNNLAKKITDLPQGANFEIKVNSIDEFPSIIASANIWDKIFKKSFIEENGITFPDSIPAEDSLFLLNAFINANGIKFINKIIVIHDYQRQDSVSHQFSKTKIMMRLKAYFIMYYLCIEKNKTEIFKHYLLVTKLTYVLVEHIWKCNLPITDILEILIYARPLFKLYVDYGGVPENLEVFEYIANDDYETALKFLFDDAICQKDIKVATMFDSFLQDSFKYEFDSIELHHDSWLNQLESEKPDLLMHGFVKDEILEENSLLLGEDGHILSDILKYCNQNNIPTVFWSSAVHLSEKYLDSNFIENTLKFDYIFTGCEESNQQYKLNGHENVNHVTEAVQPKLFNPIKKDKLDVNTLDLNEIGWCDVLENHTYSNRFRQILDAINFKYVPDLKHVILFYKLDDLSDLTKITRHFHSINYHYKHLKIITGENNLFLKEAILESDLENVELKDNFYFSFVDLNLNPDFVKKALLHFQYVENNIGIEENVENKYSFGKTENINNIMFHSCKYLELILNKDTQDVFYI